jgi:hypothetical protein
VTRVLWLILAAFFITGCLDIDQVVDPGATPPSLYFKVSWPEGSPDRPRVENALARILALYPTDYAPLTLKRIRDGKRYGLEWEGALGSSSNFDGTPLSPKLEANLVEIGIPLPDLFSPESLVRSNAWIQSALAGTSYRLMVRTGEKTVSANLHAGGVITPLRVVPLRDLVLVDTPLYLFASAYKRALVRVELGASNRYEVPDVSKRLAGETLQAGVVAFDRGSMLTAHGHFARLFHEARMADGDLYFFYGFTTLLVDKDPAQSRTLYLLALDWYKKNLSTMPWESGYDKAYLMLGLLYADPAVPFADKAIAKKTFDAGLSVNPANKWIRQVYEKVTGEKIPGG